MRLPLDFIARIKIQFPEDWEEFLESIYAEPTTSIRCNPRKNMERVDLEKVPWSSHGYYLETRPKFTLDPLFHAGAFYVQESSSMFIDYILEYIKSKISLDRVLDLCAAPGGKSTIVLDHLEDHQYLLANEIIPQRNNVLRENLTKWGRPNFIVSQNRPKEFVGFENHFDCILLDAPCSGEGLFRKDKSAMSEWNVHTALMCSERQYDIFLSVWDSLKEGGYLIYSTCTYNPDENENLLERLLRDGYKFSCEPLEIEKDWKIERVEVGAILGYRFLPHRVKGEGFFCSVLRKKGDYVRREAYSNAKVPLHPILNEYIDIGLAGTRSESELETRLEPRSYGTYKFENKLFLAPSTLLDDLKYYQKLLYIRQLGIEVAEEIHNRYIPTHGMAMLSFPKITSKIIEIDKNQALQFLCKETFETQIENGYHIVSYEGSPLGLIKQVGARHNNLYPKNWRILMDWRKG